MLESLVLLVFAGIIVTAVFGAIDLIIYSIKSAPKSATLGVVWWFSSILSWVVIVYIWLITI